MSQEIAIIGKDGSSSAMLLASDAKPYVHVARKRKVLEEDDYTEKIERIIERDFFPDLAKLKAQLEYQKAIDRNDLVEIARLKVKFSVRVARPDTVQSSSQSSFETPERRKDDADKVPADKAKLEDLCKDLNIPKDKLDIFLAKYTSEDNESFEEIMEETKNRELSKYPWLHLDEKEANKAVYAAMILPSIEKQALEDNRPAGLLTWPFVNKNTAMFYPVGMPYTEEEREKLAQSKKGVVSENTRFTKNPFKEVVNQSSITDAASFQAKQNEGKVGADGVALSTGEGPQVDGYGFVSMTPSPAPSAINTPLMTWGEIEGTPFRLDVPDCDFAPGTPQFKIPDVPRRDVLAHSLADKLSSHHRGRKKKALDHVASLTSPSSSYFGNSPRTPTDRLNSMSPAARKLATMKLGIAKSADPKLQASYSPVHPTTPSPRSHKTPTLSPSPRSSKAPTPVIATGASLTDNLLNLPKRKKASDFF